MRNLLQFLLKYSNFLLFLGLEIVALVFLFHHNDFQRSAYLSSANAVTGEMYAVEDAVLGYASLQQDNTALSEENARLRDQIADLENRLEPYVENDSLNLYADCRHYRYAQTGLQYIPAKVINTESGKRHNCLTLNKGKRDGVEEEMGVVGPHGVVGLVLAASERFSLVMPLTNDQMQLSCCFSQDATYGPLQWPGTDYRFASLENIPRHAVVHKGDTVVTSGLTPAFPAGLLVGTVDQALLADSDAYYEIRVRLATDFHSLRYVQVIRNEAMREQVEMENQ